MFSKWNNMPPIAKWGSFAAAIMMSFIVVRRIMGRGRTTDTNVAEFATGGAVGD
jgi:hypothetical protein